MRWFFTLLLLTNVLLAGWLYWHSDASPSAQPTLSPAPAQRRLQLLTELPVQSLQPIAQGSSAPDTLPPTHDNVGAEPVAEHPPLPDSVPEAPPPQEQALVCLQIYLLSKADDAEALAAKLSQAGLPMLGTGEGMAERQTYWVMIPPYQNSKTVRDAAAQLAKAKVRDFLVIRSGEFENGISLGLFSQKEGAESRLREIVGLKLNIRRPEIRLRTATVRSHWLITGVNGEEAVRTLQRKLDAEGLQTVPVECPTTGP